MEQQVKKPARISSVDVARRAGVSQSTVSRVFSPGTTPASDKARELVLKAAAELNYVPNILARGLNQSSTHIIGIINPRFEGQFYVDALKYLTLDLQHRGFTTMLINVPPGADLIDVVPIVFQYQVDGLIITSVELSSRLIKRCAEFKIPLIQFNRYSSNSRSSSVCLDNIRAGQEAASFLYKCGHRKLAYLSGDVNSSTNRDRQKGFEAVLHEAGLRLFGLFEGDYSYESGYQAGHRILASARRPDAIFCASDEMAMGFMDCADLEYGVKVPKDISVFGFNNSEISASPRYRLTTINQPVADMAEKTVETLLSMVNGTIKKSQRILVPGEIIIRASVANCCVD